MLHKCEKRGQLRMYGLQDVLLRTSIVLGMVAAVVTILYFTPTPELLFKSCDRPCHDLDWPMICRVKLTLEAYQTMSSSCEDCPNNATHCTNPNCATGDGVIRSIISANRQLPGPAIHICQNDILVVDVINKMPGQSVAVHWRGQPQNEAPFMDGVPFITQCPISSYTTFQYKFRASAPGTHYWHAHSGANRDNGFFGALVVRQAEKLDPHKKLYDIDDKEHMLLISEWSTSMDANIPNSLLINGKAPSGSGNVPSVFTIHKGKRYRFRVAYTGGIIGCPVTLSVDQHLLKVIALDGNPTTAYEASSVTLSKGERLDFVLKASQDPAAYYMRVFSECGDSVIEGAAVLRYEQATKAITIPKENQDEKSRKFNTAICERQLGKVCLGSINALQKMPEELRDLEVTRKVVLPFDYKVAADIDDLQASDLRTKIHRMNNLTFTYPSSPLLTQLDDVNYKTLCNSVTLPEKCKDKEICECVHIEHLPSGAPVELILVDQGGEAPEHIFHLHGYSFYVVGSRQFDEPLSVEDAKILDEQGLLFKRNLLNPVQKDTIRIPRFGAVALRFVAKNPGFWMLRDEHSRYWTRGLDVVFQVGDTSEMVPTPSNFPTCGSWVGPDFFLL